MMAAAGERAPVDVGGISPDREPIEVSLSGFAVLAGLSDIALQGLQRALVLRQYPDGHPLFSGRWPQSGDPLRLIIHGRVVRGSKLGRERAGSWSLLPGAVLGLEAVVDWFDASRDEQICEPRLRSPAGIDAHAIGPVWALELATKDFAAVFAGPGRALLERLLCAAPVRALAPSLVAALRMQPLLARAPVAELYRALEGACMVTRRQADALHAVISGRLPVWQGDGELLWLGPGGVEPFAARPWRHEGEPEPGTELVAIPRAALLEALRRSPGHARTLTQLSAGRAQLETGIELDVVVFDEGLALAREARRSLVSELALDMSAQFVERVAVVHLVADADAGQSLDLPVPPERLHVGDARSLRRDLVTWTRRWGLCFDHVLIDSSALDIDDALRGLLWSVVAELGGRARIHYVFDDPAQFDELPRRLAARVPPIVELLPIAVLGRARTLDRPPAREPELRDIAGPERVGAWLARRLTTRRRDPDVLAQQRGELPSRRAWPIDAVRLQLDQPDARACSRSRWARALGSRRVGIAVAGAGAQSYVALPLIRRLLAAGLPIDLLSGASVGAFVACFYAVAGEAGLAQLEQAWPNQQALVLGNFIDHTPMLRWLTRLSAAVDLAELPLGVIVVSTDADTGLAHHHRVGLAAKACMASGSLPPGMQSFIGDRRLLDGALVEDVPAAILHAAGATLSIAVQACPPMHADPRVLPRPMTAATRRRRSLNPALRFWDFGRSHLMLARLAAERGAAPADVVYTATTTASNPGLFISVPRIIAEAERSPALARAVHDTLARWQELRSPAPLRVRVDPHDGALELGTGLSLAFDDALALEPGAAQLLELLGRHTVHERLLDIEIGLHEHDDADAARRCRAAVQAWLPAGARVSVRERVGASEGRACLRLRLLPAWGGVSA